MDLMLAIVMFLIGVLVGWLFKDNGYKGTIPYDKSMYKWRRTNYGSGPN